MTRPTRTPISPMETHARTTLHSWSHEKKPDMTVVTVVTWELSGSSESCIWGFGTAVWIGSESNAGGGSMASAGSTTSTCATPPKKSVIRVLSRGRLKRSLRTPWWELIFVTSIESNWEEKKRISFSQVGFEEIFICLPTLAWIPG